MAAAATTDFSSRQAPVPKRSYEVCMEYHPPKCRMSHYPNADTIITAKDIALCALRHKAGCAEGHYKLDATFISSCCKGVEEEDVDHQLPRRIVTVLASMRDAGVRDVLQHVSAMPEEPGYCHRVANRIHDMIAERMRQGGTEICRHHIAKIGGSAVGWQVHIINIFAVRGEGDGAELVWYAVDRNTNAIVFPGHSAAELQSRLRKFYLLPGTLQTFQQIGISNEHIESWEDELPEWTVENLGG